MENGDIDAFLLTAPNGEQAEAAGYGEVLIELGSEIPELRDYYHLVLVANKEFAANNREALVDAVGALNEANSQVTENPDQVTQALLEETYSEVPPEIMANSVDKLSVGLEGNGALTEEGIRHLLEFSADTTDPAAASLDPAEGEGDWWTNEFVEKSGG